VRKRVFSRAVSSCHDGDCEGEETGILSKSPSAKKRPERMRAPDISCDRICGILRCSQPHKARASGRPKLASGERTRTLGHGGPHPLQAPKGGDPLGRETPDTFAHRGMNPPRSNTVGPTVFHAHRVRRLLSRARRFFFRTRVPSHETDRPLAATT
jgi:hypothetical protein